jgi:hypothetical protein
MTAPQCAEGLRIAHIMQSLGMDEENFRTFISEIYQHFTEIRLRPQKVRSTNLIKHPRNENWRKIYYG